jgi:hypothetical protein
MLRRIYMKNIVLRKKADQSIAYSNVPYAFSKTEVSVDLMVIK